MIISQTPRTHKILSTGLRRSMSIGQDTERILLETDKPMTPQEHRRVHTREWSLPEAKQAIAKSEY